MKKRIIALALVAVLCAGFQPEPVMAAEGSALRATLSGLVKTKRTINFTQLENSYYAMPLLNKQTMNDRTFLNEYVYKDQSMYSAADKFKLKAYSNDMNSPEATMYKAYNNEYGTYNDLCSWFVTYEWDTWRDYDNRWFIWGTRDGEISYLIQADLRASNHMHWKKPGWHNKLDDLAQVVFYYNQRESNQIDMLMNQPGQNSWYTLSTGWKKLPTYSTEDYLDVMFTHNQRDHCLCAASSVRRPVILFADTVAPSISSAKVTSKSSTSSDGYYYNTPGEKITFNMVFSEPLRKADGSSGNINISSNLNKYRVKLAAYNRVTRESQEVYADLVKVSGTTLSFEYTIPDDVDIIITGVAGQAQQRDSILKTGDYLYMYTASGSWYNPRVNSGWLKTTAVLSDFAGNGIDENWRAVSFSHELHVDTVDPEYTGTVIESGSMLRDQDMSKLTDDWNTKEEDAWPADIDRSQVFAGVGDWLTLAVDFNEELRTFQVGKSGAANGAEDAAHFTATLNILDESGENVTLRGETIFSRQENINNNCLLSRLRFETLNITEGMTPDPANLGPIKIIKLESDKDPVSDMCGNVLDISKIEFEEADKQEWLDTKAPTMTVDYPVAEEYEPGESDYGALTGVRMQIQLTEGIYDHVAESDAIKFKSGTAGVGSGEGANSQSAGTIYLSGTNGATYQYQVNTEETVDEYKWTTVSGDVNLPFPQVDSSVYLHLRLPREAQIPLLTATLDVTGYDYAGNKGEATGQVISCDLKENTKPVSNAAFTTLDVDGGRNVTASFTASDNGGLAEVKYKLQIESVDSADQDAEIVVPEDLVKAAQEEGDWTDVPLEDGMTYIAQTTTSVTCLPQNDNCVALYVYVKDKSGNESATAYKFQQDLRLPRFTVTIPEDNVVTRTQKLGVSLLDVDDAKAIGPVSMKEGTSWYLSYGSLFMTLIPKQIEDYVSFEGDSSEYQFRGITTLVDELLDDSGPYDSSPEDPSVEDRKPVRNEEFTGIDDVLGNLEIINGQSDASYLMSSLADDNRLGLKGLCTPKGYLRYGYSSYPEDPSGGLFLSGPEQNPHVQDDLNITQEIIDVFNTGYYGELDVAFTEVDGQVYGPYLPIGSLQFSETKRPIYTESYTVKVRMDDGNTAENPINKATFGIPVAANGQLLGSNESTWQPDARINRRNQEYHRDWDWEETVDPIAFTTLAGITVPFTVGNNRVPEWGTEDIDFENSSIEIWYSSDPWLGESMTGKYEGNFGNGPVATFALTEGGANQSFVFPEKLNDEDYQTGVYKVVVRLKTASFDHEDTFDSIDGEDYSKEVSFIFHVFTPVPSANGGVHIAYITDGDDLTDKFDHPDYWIKEDTFEDGSFSEKPLSEYTIPIIRNITADGNATYEHFVPFFTYQNEYVNNSSEKPMLDDLIWVKIWPEGKADAVPQWMKYSDYCKPLSEQNIVGFKFSFVTEDDDYANYTGPYYITIQPGETLTVCMQEYYANGEVSNIRRLTVTLPDPEATITSTVEGGTDIQAGTVLTPNVDVTCATGTPSEEVSFNVNDISSLNGIDSIHVASGGIEHWEQNDKEYWYKAEVKEVTETKENEEAEGEPITYTRSLLEVEYDQDGPQSATVFTKDKLGPVLKMMFDPHADSDLGSGNFAYPVIVAVDEKYNTTVREIGDFVKDWDPFAPIIEIAGQYGSPIDYVENGSYAIPVGIAEQFATEDLDGLTFYISTVDPSKEQDGQAAAPETVTGATDTIAIPLSELVAQGEGYQSVYDGSTPNTAGVTGIQVMYLEKDEEKDYGSDWSGIRQMGSLGIDAARMVGVMLTVSGSQPDTPVYMYAIDELGHISDLITLPAGDGVTSAPAVAKNEDGEDDISRNATDGSLTVNFTQKVNMVDPVIPNDDNKLSYEKTGIPIYKDGKYTITYSDIFGKTYTSDIIVAMDGDYQFTYSMTPDELTNQDVTFKIDTLEVNGVKTTVQGVTVTDPEGNNTLQENTDYEVMFDKSSNNMTASVKMNKNGLVHVTLAYGGDTTEKIFPITQIDKEMEEVTVYWEYDVPGDFQFNDETGKYELDESGQRLLRTDLTISNKNDDEKTDEEKEKEETEETEGTPRNYTQGHVTAVVMLKDPTTNEVLTGTNGDLRYTFPNGSTVGDTYTFEYKDAAGNTGKTTVTLNCDIKLPTPPRLAGYQMNIAHTVMTQTYNDKTFSYRVREDGVEQTLPDFETMYQRSDENDAIIQAKEILINLSTDLDAAVYLLEPGVTEEEARKATASKTFDGVALAGKNISVSKNAEFTIAIVEDSKYLEAAQKEDKEVNADVSPQKVYLIPVKIRNIPELKPVQIDFEKISNFEYWAYLNPLTNRDDNDNSLLTVTNAISETEVQYDELKHLYYHVFHDSGTYTFYYRDDVGHTGAIDATCTKDMIPLSKEVKVETRRWWPYRDTNQEVVTDNMVNFDVTFQATYNMLVKEAMVSTDGKDPVSQDDYKALSDVLEVSASVNSATVTFKQNPGKKIYLWVRGETGETNLIDLGNLSIIDKVAPTVEAKIVKPDPNNSGKFVEDDGTTPEKSVYIQFTPSEPVVCNEIRQNSSTEGGGYYTTENPMVVYVEKNGTYSYTFNDRAGNTVTSIPIEVTNVDNEAPTVVFASDTSGEGKSWDEYVEPMSNNIIFPSGKGTVYIKASEDCKYTFQGNKDVELIKDNWTPLEIDREKGGFVLMLADAAGNSTVVMLNGLMVLDTTAPKLFVSPQSITVPLGMTGNELKNTLLEGVTASDDMSKAEDIEITYDASKLKTNTTGEYVVKFTATDEQGNTSTVERYVRVYPASSLMLRASENGTDFKDTNYMNSIVMHSSRITFELSNLRGSNENGYEPCTFYVKKGMKTAGQMKNNSTKVPLTSEAQNGKLVCSYDFGETASGYYTVYIVTQDRAQYLTYLYIEQ